MEEENIIREQEEAMAELMAEEPEEEKSEAELELMRLAPVLDALRKCYGDEAEPEDVAMLLLKELEKKRQDYIDYCRHLEKLMSQEAELKTLVPDFQLMQALEDPDFLRLTAPHTGLSLSQAYKALHYAELAQAAAKESLEKLSRSVRSGGLRPRECADVKAAQNGGEPEKLSRSQRQELKRRIYAAGALGEKLYP